ncbi:hypothetical protein RQM59_02335 [Flavobacteriaceae bacterium S356]|uniref:Uncharacterized protein n=1 Tax=Asprobacillus argus TaxID=3076534 RepID=A0ABU3LCD2_9FLAO|nr:hypothetical protein [Flavobacteriaceae bacterium S356]
MTALRTFPERWGWWHTFDLLDLILFGIISFVMIAFLLLYGKKISTGKKSILNDFSENPFYQSKDILLQEKSVNDTLEYIPVKTSASIFTKILLTIMAIVVLCTPLYKLLNTGYFI